MSIIHKKLSYVITVIKFRKYNIDKYFIQSIVHISISSVVPIKSFINFSPFNTGSNPKSHTAFSCCVFQSIMIQSFPQPCFVSHDIDIFEKYKSSSLFFYCHNHIHCSVLSHKEIAYGLFLQERDFFIFFVKFFLFFN